MVRTSGRPASNATGEDEDTPMEPEAELMEGSNAAFDHPERDISSQGNPDDETPSEKRKRQARKRNRENADEEKDADDEGQQQKKARFESPKHSEKTSVEDEELKESEGESKAKDSEMQDSSDNEQVEEEEPKKTPAKKDPPPSSIKKPAAPTPATAKKKTASSRRTPGRSANQRNSQVPTEPDPPEGEMAVPTRQEIEQAAQAATATATVAINEKPAPDAKQSETPGSKENGTAAKPRFEETAADTAEDRQEEPELEQQDAPDVKKDFLSKPWLWFLIFLALQAAISNVVLGSPVMPLLAASSNAALKFYKQIYFYTVKPPTRKNASPAMLEEIKKRRREHHEQTSRWIEELKQIQRDLEKESVKLINNADALEKDLVEVKRRVSERKMPVIDLNEKLSRLQKLLDTVTSGDAEITQEGLSRIRSVLSADDGKKLLDLTTLDLWEIAEVPDKCDGEEEGLETELSEGDDAMLSVVVTERLNDWLDEARNLVASSTSDILKNDEVNRKVQSWLRNDLKNAVKWEELLSNIVLENVTEIIVEKVGEKEDRSVDGALKADAIVAQVEDRLEIDIADQTGEFDYASIRNGASIIRRGPRATSLSVVQNLPFLNRLLSFTGLRFYGHGPEAALTPTNPPDALGQCWAFQSEEALAKKRRKPKSAQDFSRGSFATLAVRLAKSIYVHSVVIEHPPLEITDRMESAVRIFRIVGYEDKFATEGSFELGRFEYKLGMYYFVFFICDSS